MVHICAACDDKYSKYLGVLITSIHSPPDRPTVKFLRVVFRTLSQKPRKNQTITGNT